jgi:branched-chain amino acid transport system permease protein
VTRRNERLLLCAILVLSLAAPFVFPAIRVQLSFVWVMVVFALTWDMIGGRMGYNSFGNVVFFGVGMYACAVVQIGLFYDVARYTGSGGTISAPLTTDQFLIGLIVGMAVSAVLAVLLAATLGSAILGLRGHYFAIGTLGVGVAAGELANGWSYVGAGSGMVPAMFPDALGSRALFFYFIFFAIAVASFFTSKWLFGTRFGLALNAIRDDEDKAEAMGLHTTFYKTAAWCISAFFLGLIGGGVGIVLGFIDPTETAFANATYGVWMVLMAILGGKGTLWGPVIGAVVFYVTQELFWTYLLGWQRVALGVLIVVIVVFFPTGILGWIHRRRSERAARRSEAPAGEDSGKARTPAA